MKKVCLSFGSAMIMFVVCITSAAFAQQQTDRGSTVTIMDKRAQIPRLMQKSYFEVTFGTIYYPFSAEQLQPGYRFKSVEINHPAVRLVLLGYEFNKNLAAQLTYMRPVIWVYYNYQNERETTGEIYNRSVWMNIAGLTLKPKFQVGKRFSVYGEGGLAIITRHGFKDDLENWVVKDINFSTVTFGAGLVYRMNDKLGLQLTSSFSPAGKKNDQPYTFFMGGGIQYKFGPFKEERLRKAAERGQIHPKQWIQVGVSSNVIGYGVNNAFAESSLFWGGNSEVGNGLSLSYVRNIFHAPRVFAMDWGVNVSYWQTKINRENFFTMSVFPVFRFNILHTNPFDAYFYYSLGGPSFISKTVLDGDDTGKRFTFYDAIALGAFFGKTRQCNVELRIGHYSNGNVFPQNGGVKIPLSLNLGIAF